MVSSPILFISSFHNLFAVSGELRLAASFNLRALFTSCPLYVIPVRSHNSLILILIVIWL